MCCIPSSLDDGGLTGRSSKYRNQRDKNQVLNHSLCQTSKCQNLKYPKDQSAEISKTRKLKILKFVPGGSNHGRVNGGSYYKGVSGSKYEQVHGRSNYQSKNGVVLQARSYFYRLSAYTGRSATTGTSQYSQGVEMSNYGIFPVS